MAAEKARGGPDWGARAQAAAAGPIAEIAEHSHAVQRFRWIEGKLDDRNRNLRTLQGDATRPPEVKRCQAVDLETEIADLKTARRNGCCARLYSDNTQGERQMADGTAGVQPGRAAAAARQDGRQGDDDWLAQYTAERERAASQRILGSIDERLGRGRIAVETDYDILKR
jgi:hypothetical protein